LCRYHWLSRGFVQEKPSVHTILWQSAPAVVEPPAEPGADGRGITWNADHPIVNGAKTPGASVKPSPFVWFPLTVPSTLIVLSPGVAS